LILRVPCSSHAALGIPDLFDVVESETAESASRARPGEAQLDHAGPRLPVRVAMAVRLCTGLSGNSVEADEAGCRTPRGAPESIMAGHSISLPSPGRSAVAGITCGHRRRIGRCLGSVSRRAAGTA
jgi:hypothetical protein